MLISHQKLTPKLSDFILARINSLFGKFDDSDLKRFIPHKNIYWTGSGRSALYHILKENNIKKVALPSFTCSVVFDACEKAGCMVEFIDSSHVVQPENIDEFNVDALIIPYNFGFTCDIEKIKQKCKKNNVLLIEDCAQALGAKFNGKLAGSFGDYAFYSFGISKNIGYLGGLISTDRELDLKQKKYPLDLFFRTTLKAKISRLFFNRYLYPLVYSMFKDELEKPHDSLDYKMLCFAKKVILEQFKRYDKILAVRKSNAEYCMKELEGVVDFVKSVEGTEPAWLYFVLLSKDRDELRKKLFKENIDVQPLLSFKDLSGKGKKASKIEQEHLVFALYRSREEIEYIVKKIKKVCT
jgi:dTDP-4-amino-4,6-dideoxygalactose transaminase